MKSKKIQKNNSLTFLLIVLTGLLAILLVAVYLNMLSSNFYNQSQTTSNSNETKIYRSRDLKFSIKVPTSFNIKSSNTGVDLVGIDGSIEIVRNSTNSNNLSDYIEIFDARRNIIGSEVKKTVIDGSETMFRIAELPEESVKKKSYYIYVDYSVYILSTSSDALFDDLDEIAQSFRYTP